VVEQGLRQAIIRGDFGPGAHLIDRELCDMFDVSRTVVREAQRSLEAEGLVEIVPHRGVFVRRISYEEAKEIYDVRKVLEPLAGRKCALHASSSEVQELEALYDELRSKTDSPGGAYLVEFKTRFYDVLLRGTKSKLIEKMLGQLLNYNTQLRTASLSEPGRFPRTVEEIEAIIDAIKARDSAAASYACLAHVENASRAALHVLKEREAEESQPANVTRG
jgi:DNA-binding GntR family transcriptional regulator